MGHTIRANFTSDQEETDGVEKDKINGIKYLEGERRVGFNRAQA